MVLNKPFPALSNLLLFHHQPGPAGGEQPRQRLLLPVRSTKVSARTGAAWLASDLCGKGN